jgi:hypothetical protein
MPTLQDIGLCSNAEDEEPTPTSAWQAHGRRMAGVWQVQAACDWAELHGSSRLHQPKSVPQAWIAALQKEKPYLKVTWVRNNVAAKRGVAVHPTSTSAQPTSAWGRHHGPI